MDMTGAFRDAVAWVRGESQKSAPAKAPPNSGQVTASEDKDKSSDNPLVWFWEAMQGDFNEDRNTKQLLVDAAISMIPLVDQVCDVRDLIANCRKINRDPSDGWAWTSLALTLIGLFPSLGSLVKGVLKIFFAFIRRAGADKIGKAIDDGLNMVVMFIRRRDVQKYLKDHKVTDVFNWLAKQIKEAKGWLDVKPLLAHFDTAIKTLEGLANKAKYIPNIGAKAKELVATVRKIRDMADKPLGKVLKPIEDIMERIIKRLEKEGVSHGGAVDARNLHYRGTLPEHAAIPLMIKFQPSWLKLGDKELTYSQCKPADFRDELKRRSRYAEIVVPGRAKPVKVQRKHEDVWPELTDSNIRSFNTLAARTIKGPAKLYRILAPNSKGMSDCWVSEEVFNRLQRAKDPKAAWRKYLAVWPDWNGNGQFVIYHVKAGESLNVWRGIASSQTKTSMPGWQLEGGYEQIVFKVAAKDVRNDVMLHYKIGANGKPIRGKAITQADIDAMKMTPDQKAEFYRTHMSLRSDINHPNISGPFETGWDYSDFDGRALSGKIGLPLLPGQSTTLR